MMEDISVLKSNDIIRDKIHRSNVNGDKISQRRIDFSPAIVTQIKEGGINFFHYFKSLNLSKESEMLVLPSNHHYFYDEKELKGVRILVNLGNLNSIKHLDMFLNNLVHILPLNANFIGCFSDNKTLNVNGSPSYNLSRLFSRFINVLDNKTDHIMNKNEVSELLGKNGFKTIDMKEINGLTYFYCKTTCSG
jgi:hypothetical protein